MLKLAGRKSRSAKRQGEESDKSAAGSSEKTKTRKRRCTDATEKFGGRKKQ